MKKKNTYSVIVVDDDENFTGAVIRELDAKKFRAFTAKSTDEAVEILKQQTIDIMLTDLRMDDLDGIDLIKLARMISPQTRTVLMIAYATAKDHIKAVELGAFEVLNKPFTHDELQSALNKALEFKRGFHVDLHGLALTDILQMFNCSKKSVTLNFGSSNSAIHIQGGEIIHAKVNNLTGKVALKELFSTHPGDIKAKAFEPSPVTINEPLQSLLLNLMRQIDEERRDGRAETSSDENGTSFFNSTNDKAYTDAEIIMAKPIMQAKPRKKLIPLLFGASIFAIIVFVLVIAFRHLWHDTPSSDADPKAVSNAEAPRPNLTDTSQEKSTEKVSPTALKTRQITLTTKPPNLFLIDASSGDELGTSPLTLKIKPEQLPFHVKGMNGNQQSPPVLVIDRFRAGELQRAVEIDFSQWFNKAIAQSPQDQILEARKRKTAKKTMMRRLRSPRSPSAKGAADSAKGKKEEKQNIFKAVDDPNMAKPAIGPIEDQPAIGPVD